MTTLQIRIDDHEKEKAKEILKNLGLDLSGAVKIFLKAVVRTRGIPFSLTTKNGFSTEFEDEVLAMQRDAQKHPEKLKSLRKQDLR